jgi:DNA ligase 1
MLATNVEKFDALRFPALVSPKLDGVRATMQGGRLLSRSLKPIPNENVQKKFSGLPEGFDGELIVGDASDDPYRRTVSVVMSDDKPADEVQFYAFDWYGSEPYQTRLTTMRETCTTLDGVVIVPHFPVANLDELEACEETYLAYGYEGLMYRDPNGPYKQGRSSEREGWLLKVKRFKDAEAMVVGTYEEMENQNAAFTNELGRTARSSAKAGKVGKGRLGGFHVKGMMAGEYAGVEFDVASGAIDHATREELWAKRETLISKIVVYKYFPTGGDTRPRHPIFKGFRDKRDMS